MNNKHIMPKNVPIYNVWNLTENHVLNKCDRTDHIKNVTKLWKNLDGQKVYKMCIGLGNGKTCKRQGQPTQNHVKLECHIYRHKFFIFYFNFNFILFYLTYCVFTKILKFSITKNLKFSAKKKIYTTEFYLELRNQ